VIFADISRGEVLSSLNWQSWTIRILCFPCLYALASPVLQAQQIMVSIGSEGKRVYSNQEAPTTTEDLIIPGTPVDDRNNLEQSISPPPHIDKMIQQFSTEHGVDPELVKAVAKVESNFNPYAVSYKGAHGIMQLIPRTARRFGVKNVYDPKQNIEGGIKYLKFLSQMFPENLPHVLAAYNAGENAVLKFGGVPPYRETQNYVRRIIRIYSPRENPKKGLMETAQNEPERVIVRSMDASGRVIYSNVEGAY
jgi:hypothetical protein